MLNEIDGKDHSGTEQVGMPAIFGMNFQAVSTAREAPDLRRPHRGYLADGTPRAASQQSPGLRQRQVRLELARCTPRSPDTTVILSAKHGQSPKDSSALTRVPTAPIIDGLNAAWKTAHPAAQNRWWPSPSTTTRCCCGSTRSPAAKFAKDYLLSPLGTGNDINGAPKPYTLGVEQGLRGQRGRRFFGTKTSDARVPDIFGIAQYGVVYTGGKAKIAEHGGANPAGPRCAAGGLRRQRTNTRTDTARSRRRRSRRPS